MPLVETLALASLLAIVVNRITEWWPKRLVQALVQLWVPEPRRVLVLELVIPIVAVGVSFIVVWWAEVNLLPVIQNAIVARIVTVILCAGGASLINDVFGPFTKRPAA